MNSLTESAVRERLPAAFDEALFDLAPGFDRGLLLGDVEGLDSVSRVRLMLSVERAFGIEISPKENGELRTIGDLVDLIVAKVATAGRLG